MSAETHGREPTVVRACVTQFERGERWRRAAAVFVPLLAAALVSVPIPGWHLVGAPGFAIAALVLGRRRLRQDLAIESLRGPCPACGESRCFAAPSPPEFPAIVSCPGCREFLKLSLLR